MDIFIQQVVSGLATGGIYASLGLALVMIYHATDHINFAQGEMSVVGPEMIDAQVLVGEAHQKSDLCLRLIESPETTGDLGLVEVERIGAHVDDSAIFAERFLVDVVCLLHPVLHREQYA